MLDGWRHTYPDEKDFTFQADATGSQSRTDRIYASQAVLDTAFEWEITDTSIKTDHRLVSVRIAKPDTPECGPGRWAMPAIVIDNSNFLDSAVARGKRLEAEMAGIDVRTEELNKQTAFKSFKADIRTMARRTAKRLIPKIKQQIQRLSADRKETLNKPNLTEDDAKHMAGVIGEHIRNLEYRRHEKARMTVKVTDRLGGETIGPYLTALNAHRPPKEILHRLRVPGPGPAVYTTSTKKMTKIARNHHNTLQDEDAPWAPERRNLTIENITEAIEEKDRLNDQDAERMGRRIEKQEVIDALKASASAKAPGLDGIPYEFWAALKKRDDMQREREPQDHDFDVMKALTTVFNDVEDFGVVDKTEFAEGWMYPLYKKKDRTDIANYRPITLLNTDYKVFTKVLASRLAKIAHKMVNKAQAGFIPDRSIADQIRLAQLMTDYCEATEENGMIVCLDQEKAYDKIKHDYLWITLCSYGLPEHFIDIVRSLYSSARTKVMVNGELSAQFNVTRGVRQGDPLSCLLFNLAIKPLANLLRLSPRLKGFNIPGSTEKLIATLFADDTTIYLSEADDFKHLKVELDRWCLASGARFNVMKTEIVPLGTPAYRQHLRATRQCKPGGSRLPGDIHITAEGEATRSLGGWIGNGLEQTQIWEKTMDKVQASLDRWAIGRPTIHLKAKIVQITVGAMTQYLTTIQGMPKQVEARLEKATKGFLWDGGRAPLKADLLYRAPEEGGIGLLDLKSRNEAIELRWCSKYLDLGRTRPMWALVVDVLFEGQIPKSQGLIDKEVTINLFLQTWRPSRGGHSKLPRDLARMITVSRQYDVRLDAIRLTDRARKSLPAWYHMGTEDHPGRLHSRLTSKCLKRQHKAMKVKDMVAITKRLRDTSPGHRHCKLSTCVCKHCKRDRRRGCTAPWRCCEAAQDMLNKLKPRYKPGHNPEQDNLSLTQGRKESNKAMRDNDGYITFNPSLVKGENLESNFRVFGSNQNTDQAPAFRRRPPLGAMEEDTRTVYTSGACAKAGHEDASAGGGVWYGEDDDENAALRVPGERRSKLSGEIAAVLHVAQCASPFAPLRIVSTSKEMVDILTHRLPGLEEAGYIKVADRDLIKATVATLRERGSVTEMRFCTSERGSDEASALSKLGAGKPDTGEITATIPANFDLDGAQLSTLTQARAYAGIRERKTAPRRILTDIRLDMTRHAVLETEGFFPTDKMIWAAARHPDISRNIRNFLWKTLHQTQKIGEFWENVPTMTNRAICGACGVVESMDHILFDCETVGSEVVWSMSRSLWEMKGGDWPNPGRTSDVLASTLMSPKDGSGRSRPGAARLYKILVTESAFLVWKLRNERVIGGINPRTGQHTTNEVRNRWISAVNTRLRLDIAMTRKQWGQGRIPKTTVLRTWSNTLQDETSLPDDWTTNESEVLVGIRTLERRKGQPHTVAPD